MTPLMEAVGVAVDGRLEPTDLRCAPGELVAIIGPNGAGKTSLLRALAGIEPCEGHVTIAGEDAAAAPPSRRMRLLSFLPATRALVWPISARDVIALGLPSPEPARVEELIETLELRSLADRPVNSLSTGERSRVLLARALAARPHLLLLDEPLANLDPYWVLSTLDALRQVAANEQCSVLASLHDLAQAVAFDRALLVHKRQVVLDRSPEEMLASEHLREAFRIERSGTGWRIREDVSPAEGPQSLQ